MPKHLRAPRALVLAFVAVLLSLGPAVAPRAAAAAMECTQDWRSAAVAAYLQPDGSPTQPSIPLPAPPTSDHRAFHVFCAGHYVNTVWLAPHVNTREAIRVAVELVARAVFPTVEPAVNPARGLTGLASWFWAQPGASPVMMRRGNGPLMDVELRVATVRWRFGDGTPGPVSGLGTPFPAPSPVAHVFERKGAYTVAAQVVVAARFWYEELFFDLPTGSHTRTLPYRVAELRTLLHTS
jgi:hypothetical protein